MKRINLFLPREKTLLSFLCLIAFISLFFSCASQKPEFTAAFYNFQYKGDYYRIRSISSVNQDCSFNELIGKKFVAKDYDQDGFIDEIALGEIDMAEAQKIYAYTLNELTSKDKLREVSPNINKYQLSTDAYTCEIKTFRPATAEPFNQFKMTKGNRVVSPYVIIGIDYMANGTIDELIDGDTSMETIQKIYTEALEKGLEKKALIKNDGMILVQ